MSTLEEFKNKIKKVSSSRTYKVTNSLGVYDGYKYYRKNKPKDKKYILTESQYFSIIRKVNNLLIEDLLNGNDIKLPKSMGTIEIRKYDRNIYYDSKGVLHNNLPINWDKTLELWYNDSESYNKKTLIREESSEIFKLYYNRELATYNNKIYYEFLFNKEFKIKLNRIIRSGVIDAPFLSKKLKWLK